MPWSESCCRSPWPPRLPPLREAGPGVCCRWARSAGGRAVRRPPGSPLPERGSRGPRCAAPPPRVPREQGGGSRRTRRRGWKSASTRSSISRCCAVVSTRTSAQGSLSRAWMIGAILMASGRVPTTQTTFLVGASPLAACPGRRAPARASSPGAFDCTVPGAASPLTARSTTRASALIVVMRRSVAAAMPGAGGSVARTSCPRPPPAFPPGP